MHCRLDEAVLAARCRVIVAIAAIVVGVAGVSVAVGLLSVSGGFRIVFDGIRSLELMPEILFGKLNNFALLFGAPTALKIDLYQLS